MLDNAGIYRTTISLYNKSLQQLVRLVSLTVSIPCTL